MKKTKYLYAIGILLISSQLYAQQEDLLSENRSLEISSIEELREGCKETIYNPIDLYAPRSVATDFGVDEYFSCLYLDPLVLDPNVYLYENKAHVAKWTVANNSKDKIYRCVVNGGAFRSVKFDAIANYADCTNPHQLAPESILTQDEIDVQPGEIKSLSRGLDVENRKICSIEGSISCQEIECIEDGPLPDKFIDLASISGMIVEGSACSRRKEIRTCANGKIQTKLDHNDEYVGIYAKDSSGNLYCEKTIRCIAGNETYTVGKGYSETFPVRFTGTTLNTPCAQSRETFTCGSDGRFSNSGSQPLLSGYRSNSGKCLTKRSCTNGKDHGYQSPRVNKYCGRYLYEETWETCNDGKYEFKRHRHRPCDTSGGLPIPGHAI
ncbi:MAG: hypothetical protein ACOH5I_25420 [Oligoflexus sp.]